MRESLAVLYTTPFSGDYTPFVADDIERALKSANLLSCKESPIDICRPTGSSNQAEPAYYNDNILHLDLATKRMIFDKNNQANHISLFALAPQPLLIYLGTLLNDKLNVDVFQCHRDSEKWTWRKEQDVKFIVEIPENNPKSKVALSFSLSFSVAKERIHRALGQDVDIYNITIESPNRHFVTHPDIMKEFVATSRNVMESIKQKYGNSIPIYVFPAMPNSLAIRFGMDYMPKADNPLSIYDQVGEDGFIWATNIGR